jgi:putative addiction module component (TIGR02574 family)
MSSAMQLAPQDRCRVASALWDSTRSQAAEVDDDLESLLDQREAELEQDPSLEVSHEAFLGHFSHRRRS